MALSKTETMARHPLFKGLRKHDLEFLASNMDEIDVPAGQRLITEGDPNHAFFVLEEGQVEVTVGGKRRRVMGPGEFFGEISMDALMKATATVTTTSPVHAFVVSHAQFGALEGNQTVLLHLKEAIADRLETDRASEQR